MEIKLLEQARIDLEYWKKTGNKAIVNLKIFVKIFYLTFFILLLIF